MIVVVDSSVLLHLIDPNLPVPPGPDGILPEKCRERLDHLIDRMSKNGDRMIVPAPVLAEVLVHAGAAGPDWLMALHGRRAIQIAPFDERAAVECAAQTSLRKNRPRRSARAKAKFDEQIVAIAIVAGAEMILSDDTDMRDLAPPTVAVKGVGDLEMPDTTAQADMFPDGK